MSGERLVATEILIGLAIGAVAGVLSGMFGIGGGIIIVPALVLTAGLTQKVATGTSLAALLLPVGILAVLEYSRRGEVRVRYAVGIAIGLTVGALVGARISGRLSNRTLEQLFGVLLALVAVRLLFFGRR